MPEEIYSQKRRKQVEEQLTKRLLKKIAEIDDLRRQLEEVRKSGGMVRDKNQNPPMERHG